MEHLAGIVFTAGTASRIKKSGALLYTNGQSELRQIVHAMQRAGASPIIVVTGYHAMETELRLDGEHVVFVHNTRYYETEMFDSIRLGLSVLGREIERVMIYPADVPFVTEQTVRLLLAVDGTFVCPSYRGHSGYPVVIGSSLFSDLAGYGGEQGLWEAAEAAGIRPHYVTVEDRSVLLNSDTCEDYNQMFDCSQEQTGGRKIQLNLDLRLNIGNFVFDSMVAQLLELVDATGSLERACACMHQKLFWGIVAIANLEKQLGTPVLLNDAMLSAEGRVLLQKYQLLRVDASDYASFAFEKISEQDVLFGY